MIDGARTTHQYIERTTGRIVDERLYGDRLVRWLYSDLREKAPVLFRHAIQSRTSNGLGFLNYDLPLARFVGRNRAFLREIGVNFDECLEKPETLNTMRKIFERKIRFWECRSTPPDERAIVSPADSRLLTGSFDQTSALFLKEKFFSFEELLGSDKPEWLKAFSGGDFVICRLTPDKYHYNHTPVAGVVRDFYMIDGDYHSCNPSAVVTLVTPYSKNKRTVTVIDTDVPGGTGVGLVAMIEIVALMIGEIVQCYSQNRYDAPQATIPGMFLERGQPKSLYRPGSSTDVLIFQRSRVRFDQDLLLNRRRPNIQSRFSAGFGESLVETDVSVRSQIATPISM